MAARVMNMLQIPTVLRASRTVVVPQLRFFKRPPEEEPSMEWARSRIDEFNEEEKERRELYPEPHKLHMVRKVQNLHGKPHWDRKVMETLGLGEDVKVNKVTVHKNTPSMNALLMKVKHLVEVKPLRFPYGMPESESDYPYTFIQDDGVVIVHKELKQEIESRPDTAPEEDRRLMLDYDTILKDNERKLRNYELNKEYFPAQYKYRLNQDGKEYRYTKNQSKD